MDNTELLTKQIIEDLKSDKVMFENLSLEDRSKREIALVAINMYGRNLKFVSEQLKDDEEFVYDAIGYDAFAILDASERLQIDEDMNWSAILADLDYFADAPASIKNNKRIVQSLTVLLSDSMDLEYYENYFIHVSPELKDDKDFILELIRDYSYPLIHTSKRLRNNKEVVSLAIKNCKKEFLHASTKLKGDKELVRLSLECGNDETLFDASKDIRSDKSFILKCFKDFGCLSYKIPRALNNDRDLVWAAVQSWAGNLRFASFDLRDDKELVLFALKQNIDLIAVISKRLSKDIDVLKLIS